MNLETVLENNRDARERKNKWRVIAMMVYQDFPQLQDVQKNVIADVLKKGATYDREWRKVLQDNPELRGSDYDQKDELEQEAEIALGYEAGHDAKVKQLSKIK